MCYLLIPSSGFLTVRSFHSLPFWCCSVTFLNTVSRMLPPAAPCYCTTQPFTSLPAFSPSLSLLATWGNDSITYDPVHLLMKLRHSEAHLRPIKGSSHGLFSLFGATTLKLILPGICVCVVDQDASTMCVIIPCSFPPCSFSSETLTSFWFVYESMLGEFGGGEPCARKNIWHCWDTDTCCWTSEPSFKIIRN